jgi:aminopeptidase N
MYTFSDPYLAEDWWPSKQDLTDKIDSADIWITVDDTLKAGSNGLLKAVTPLPGNKERYEWKTNYPIDYYLISVVVAPYSDYSYYMHYTDGSGDSMLIQNYVYDSLAMMTPLRKANFDTTGLIVDHFSKIFGRYPFDKEKYGHCVAEPLPGGMEHQTMTTLGGSLTTTLIAHELGHQWWGNSVTYGSWADIWLSEGFAAYCEQLYVEHFRSMAAANEYRTNVFNRVMMQAGGTVLVDDTTDVNRIFSSRLTYDKGAAVAHMLRYLAPNDGLYFDVLRQYQQQFKYGLAKTQDLQSIAEQKYGKDLDTFFNQWIYKEGYPTYKAKWDQVGPTVYIVIEQTTSVPSSVQAFAMPLELKLKSANGDWTVKVYNNNPWQGYQFTWNLTMTGLEIDPDNHIVNKTGTIKKDPTAGIVTLLPEESQIYPNPTVDQWFVERVPVGSVLQLSSIDGRLVWSGVSTVNQMYIPAEQLASGMYMLTISKDNMSKTYKLVK